MAAVDEKLAALFVPDAPPLINIGCGEDVTIRQLAEIVARVVGFSGDLVFDTSKPDGTPRKLMAVSRLSSLGWTYNTTLESGIFSVYHDFLNILR